MEPTNSESLLRSNWEYFRDRMWSQGDVVPDWPEGVRSFTPDTIIFLGIDKENRLYWDGKPIEIQRKLKFTRLQLIGALFVGLATIAGGLGTGLNEGFDLGCKLQFWSEGCKP